LESGVSRYFYTIGTSPGLANIAGWTDNGQLTSVTRTGLTLSVNTTYYFIVKAENGVLLQSTATISNGQVVLPVPDTTGPVITNVLSGNISQTGATITWDTDEPSTSQVEYGPTLVYGDQTAPDSSLVTSHIVVITGLTPDTQYHFRVISKDDDINQNQSGDNTFTTLTVPAGTDKKAFPNPYSISSNVPMTFRLAMTGAGEVKIYTMNGKLVRELTGTNNITWDGNNQDGEKVARGVYLYKITESNGDVITGKLAILK
jgi:hypothetical protein